MEHSFDVAAYRDGKWWTFEIPALSSISPRGADHRIVAMGQASKASKIERAAKEVASLWTGEDTSHIAVNITYRMPREVQSAMEKAHSLDAQGREALEQAARLRRQAVQDLRTLGFTQADAAAALGLSRQRVQQLEH